MTETSSPQIRSGTTESYSVQFDRLDDEPLSVTVADAVATFTGLDVTELDPLHYAIDADALERLFEPRANGLRSDGTVSFAYNECLVTVSAGGEIDVESLDD